MFFFIHIFYYSFCYFLYLSISIQKCIINPTLYSVSLSSRVTPNHPGFNENNTTRKKKQQNKTPKVNPTNAMLFLHSVHVFICLDPSDYSFFHYEIKLSFYVYRLSFVAPEVSLLLDENHGCLEQTFLVFSFFVVHKIIDCMIHLF